MGARFWKRLRLKLRFRLGKSASGRKQRGGSAAADAAPETRDNGGPCAVPPHPVRPAAPSPARSKSSGRKSESPIDRGALQRLDHSAAKHRIAVRPKNRKNRKPGKKTVSSKRSSPVSETDVESLVSSASSAGVKSKSSSSFSCFDISLMLRSSSPRLSKLLTRKWKSDEESAEVGSCSSVFFESGAAPKNSNVIFRRPSFHELPAAAPTSRECHAKFLLSIESWTLANEGLKRSIFNLGSQMDSLNPGCATLTRKGSLESLSSSTFATSSRNEEADDAASSILGPEDDLLEMSAPTPDSDPNDEKPNEHGFVEASEMRVLHESCATTTTDEAEEEDELENICVRDLRRLYEVDKPVVAEVAEVGSSRQEGGVRQQSSLVRAIVMKFDQLSD